MEESAPERRCTRELTREERESIINLPPFVPPEEYRPYGRRDRVSDYMRERYMQCAGNYWDKFYQHNTSNFFKDRHYLQHEFPCLLEREKTVLEVGCGVGNSTIPLLQENPTLSFHCFDISSTAVSILKKHELFDSRRCTAFVWDVATQEVPAVLKDKTFDFALIIFVLSAIPPHLLEKTMATVAKMMRAGGRVLIRDYASGDLAEERFQTLHSAASTVIGESCYVRGDGTLSYFFTLEAMERLGRAAGLTVAENVIQEKCNTNAKEQKEMRRKFIQTQFVKPAN